MATSALTAATTAAAGWVIDQTAQAIGAHARLHAINKPFNQTVQGATNIATRALYTLKGANLAMDPYNLRAAELIGKGVYTGVNMLGTAFIGPNGTQVKQAVVGGVIVTGGVIATEVVPTAITHMPFYLNAARIAYLLMNRESSTNETSNQDESKPLKEQQAFLGKVDEVAANLKGLNPEEVEEVQKMIEELEDEMSAENQSKMDQAIDLVQELVFNAGVSALTGGLANLAKLSTINGAYQTTIASAGKFGRETFCFMGDNMIGEGFRNGAAFVTRNFSRIFIAPRIATSTAVMASASRAAAMTSFGVNAAVTAAKEYAEKRAPKKKKKKRSLLKTAGKIATCVAGGAAVLVVQPGAFVSAAGGLIFSKALELYNGRRKASAKDHTASNTKGINDVKVSAAFFQLIQLSSKKEKVLNQIPAKPIASPKAKTASAA